ncbi:MAG: hypothetical protein JWN63_2422 [Candidatus Acidoferrum typicum]|nr:hypothetical protein [Candidatus Acidoferrum typicum]
MLLRQRTVHLDLDVANLGDSHMVALHLEGCGREYQTVETVAPFESREPRCLVVLDATKEVLKGAVETNQYRLQGMRVNTLELRAHFLDGWQLGLLLQPSNTLPYCLIRLNPFLQTGIVQLPAHV